MASITINVPDEIDCLADDLRDFFEHMILKLYANRHKQIPKECDVIEYILLLQKEILEVHRQWIEDKNDPNMSKELADVSNFSFIIFSSLKNECIGK